MQKLGVATEINSTALAIADDIKLSIHGSYYIVLASPDPAKVLHLCRHLLRTYEQKPTFLGAAQSIYPSRVALRRARNRCVLPVCRSPSDDSWRGIGQD